MSRFDVCELAEGGIVLDCQADILEMLATRFVVPLLPVDQAPRPADRLNPVFELGGERFVMATQFAAAVDRRELGRVVASLEGQHHAIMNALDMLLTGC
jgi:toxin CcdB